MIRRPPRSTLFPSTTLSRSGAASQLRCHGAGIFQQLDQSADGKLQHVPALHGNFQRPVQQPVLSRRSGQERLSARSEEHTSELQSPCNLVCRLLLEKKNSPNVLEMAATETITSIILIKLIRVSLGTVRHPRRFKIVVLAIRITLKQMLRDFIGIRVNRAKKIGMVNITSSVNSRERSGINTILHFFFLNDTAPPKISPLPLHDAFPI